MQHVSVLKDYYRVLKRLMVILYLFIDDDIKRLLCLMVIETSASTCPSTTRWFPLKNSRKVKQEIKI